MQASESPGAPPDPGGENAAGPQTRLVYLATAGGLSLLAAAALFLLFRPAPREPVQIVLGPEPGQAAVEMSVYVTGAVRSPGVYLLPSGARIAALIEAAGGAAEGSDLDRVNLAARLKDGEHVHVLRVGEAAPASAQGRKLDLNRAAVKELDALPGIGSVRAGRIVASRDRDGPFKEPFDLVSRSLVPLSVYQQIKDLVAVQ